MGLIRKVLFWLHLSAGVMAGVVILIMSITGVALTYERQMVQWSSQHLRSVPPSPTAQRLSIEAVLGRVRSNHPATEVTGLTVGSAPDAAIVVAAEPEPLFLDAYSGQSLGGRQTGGLRAFMSEMRAWHRWLAVEGESRPFARAVTGWSNLLFLFIVVSGAWIWFPRVRTWAQFKSVMLFRRQYGTSKARDFNWHNVIGVWSAVPLFIVVISAVPISFPWASDLVYRAVGDEPPVRRAPGGPGGPPGAARRGRPQGDGAAAPRRSVQVDGLNQLWAKAAADQPGWQTINVRFPRRDNDPFVFSIDRSDGGQPHLRSTLTLDRTGALVDRETFADQASGRQIRSIMRFAHTGEVLGLAGQTVAGLVSAGAVVMVWTGLALTWRRCCAWLERQRAVHAFSAPVTESIHEHRSETAVHPSIIATRAAAPPSQESAS
jgi:uncharacterized iron-regulated membrane protein